MSWECSARESQESDQNSNLHKGRFVRCCYTNHTIHITIKQRRGWNKSYGYAGKESSIPLRQRKAS